MIALYLRLSMSDGDLGHDGKDESNSIENQRAIIRDYIRNSEDVSGEVTEYIDDGYSGTNFNRPAFKRMIRDMKKGMISTMITKDLSRLGRNYIEVGDYMEQIFPMLGVRYIAVNSNYDSSEYIGSTAGMEMSFMNLVNSLYSKDLSKKWHSAVETKWKNGLSTSGRMPLGYVRDPKQKGKWVIEPYAFGIVREIYDLVNEGLDLREIVERLNEEHVLNPGQYREMMGHQRGIKRKVTDDEWLWNTAMLRKILLNYEYTGALVQSKTRATAVGSRFRRVVPKSERFIMENHHEAIITKAEFERGKGLIKTTSKRERVNKRNYPLADVIYCGNCRLRMEYSETIGGSYMKCGHKQLVGSASKCNDDKYPTSIIDSVVRSALRRQLLEMELLEIKLSNVKDAEGIKETASRIENQIRTLRANKTRSYELYAEGKITKDEYMSRRDSIRKSIDKLQQDRESLRIPDYTTDDLRREARKYIEAAEESGNGMSLSRSEVDTFIEKVLIYDENHMEVVFKFDDLIKRIIKETGEEDGG